MLQKYTNKLSGMQTRQMLLILGKYFFMLLSWLVVAKLYANFGKSVVIPVVSIMFFATAFTCFFIKEDRENTLREGGWFILGYIGFLFIYRIFIQLITPITSEQMNASLNIASSAVSGIATSGLLQNLLVVASVFTPLGYVVWCAKKFTIFRVRSTKQEALRKYQGYKTDNRDR